MSVRRLFVLLAALVALQSPSPAVAQDANGYRYCVNTQFGIMCPGNGLGGGWRNSIKAAQTAFEQSLLGPGGWCEGPNWIWLGVAEYPTRAQWTETYPELGSGYYLGRYDNGSGDLCNTGTNPAHVTTRVRCHKLSGCTQPEPPEPPPPPVKPLKNLGSCCTGDAPSPLQNGSNPINGATGNKYQREVDYAGAMLRFDRHYNSFAEFDGAAGARWRHSYERAITVVDANTVTVQRADGTAYDFTLTGGQWLPDADVTLRLSQAGSDWYLTDNAETVERYDAAGRLVSITPRGGVAQTLAYNGSDQLVSVDDGFGRTLSFSYADGWLATLTDSAGGVYLFDHDSEGNLIEVIAPDGGIRTYHYDDAPHPHALTSITDESGRTVGAWTYDAEGRAVSSEGAGGANRVEFSFDADGETVVTDTRGGSRIYRFELSHGVWRTIEVDGDACLGCSNQDQAFEYDANGFVVSATDRNGVETRYTRDTRGLELSRIEAFGTPQARTITTQWDSVRRIPLSITEPGRETSYTYDGAGRRLSMTVTDLATSTARTTSWSYDAAGRVLTTTDARGNTSTNAYDSQGNLISVTNALGQVTQFGDYDAHGNARRITDANGVVTTLIYDVRQRLSARSTAGETTSFAYDGAGRLTRLTPPDGAFVDYGYDAVGRLVSITDRLGNRIDYTLDATGNRIEEHVSGSGGLARESFATYDTLNRLVATLGGEGQSMDYTHDPVGNPLTAEDAAGNTTTTHYDALNRVFQTVDALSGVTAYAYDPLDRLVQVVDPRGVTTDYVYNAFGDVLEVASPDAGTTVYEYDANGNRIRQTDARGIVTEYDYDALNRLIAVRYPSAPAENITYTWDTAPFGVGRIARITDASGSTEYEYDAHGRVTARISTVRGTTLPHFQSHEPGGHLSTLMHPDGAEVSYTRDAAGRISAIHWTEPGESPQPIVTGISWQPFGGISSFTFGDGSTQARSYDRSGRLTTLISGTVLNRAYGWDTTDNITAIADLIDPTRSQMFGYDGLYRLTFAQGIYGSHSYQYDALGNRTRLNTDTASTSYAYATASNRLTSVDEGTGAVSIAYDPAGNTLDDGARSFTYNARNRLSEADGHSYGYNAHNLRVFKPRFGIAGDASGDGLITEADLTLLQQALNGQGTASLAMDCNQDGVVNNRDTPCIARQIGANRNQGQGQGNGGGQGNGNGNGNGSGGPPPAPTTEPAQVGWVLFTHDEQGRLIGEYDEQGNPLRRYIWLNDLPVALIDAAGIHYIHTDHLNTPQAVTDSLGTLVWATDYAPFGEVTETIATLELNLRFPGQYLDRETGLHQNWHREYDPMTGRYTQSDPIGLGGGMNTFVYAMGSPTRLTDVFGLQADCCGITRRCRCRAIATTKWGFLVERWYGHDKYARCDYECRVDDEGEEVVTAVGPRDRNFFRRTSLNDSGWEPGLYCIEPELQGHYYSATGRFSASATSYSWFNPIDSGSSELEEWAAQNCCVR